MAADAGSLLSSSLRVAQGRGPGRAAGRFNPCNPNKINSATEGGGDEFALELALAQPGAALMDYRAGPGLLRRSPGPWPLAPGPWPRLRLAYFGEGEGEGAPPRRLLNLK